jgi:hypothetical protein
MSNHHSYTTDIIGIVSGFCGYIFSKIGLIKPAFLLSGLLSSWIELFHSLSTAVLCAIAGFITTRLCSYIWIKIKKRYEKNIQ